jgi:hypothetical protein
MEEELHVALLTKYFRGFNRRMMRLNCHTDYRTRTDLKRMTSGNRERKRPLGRSMDINCSQQDPVSGSCKHGRPTELWDSKERLSSTEFVRPFHSSMALQPFVGPWPLLQFRNLFLFTQTVGLLGRVISLSQGRYLHTGQHKNKRTQTSMPWVGFESTIPAFERAKTVHAFDHAATVIDLSWC